MRLQRAIGCVPKRFASIQQAGTAPIGARTASSAAIRIPTAASSSTAPARVSQRINITRSVRSAVRSGGTRSYASSSSSGPLQRTALYDMHLAHGAKMVPFGGFEMPVQYSSLGVSASHHFTRTNASLFDVGHMVQHRFEGAGARQFLERITPASLKTLPVHQGTLSTLLWPGTGGIVDDTVITKLGEDLFYVVTNAACREKDLKYLEEQLVEFRKENTEAGEIKHEVLDNWGLVALQGPMSEQILKDVLADDESASSPANLRELYFGQSKFLKLKGCTTGPVLVSRAGYTGEDGFEISISPEDTVAVTQALLDTAGPERLQWAGLGARDSLRLEAGMCLYGHDLDDTTTPVEGALGWVVGKDRRDPGAPANQRFHGADVILPQLILKSKGGKGVDRRRVGLVVSGAPAREGAEILDKEGNKIGVVTSGCPSPTLGKNIAMGYIKDGMHKSGTEVEVLVRGKKRAAVVNKMPFIPTQYWKGTAPA